MPSGSSRKPSDAWKSPEAIQVDHPRLTLDDILAAQVFAADYLADEDVTYG